MLISDVLCIGSATVDNFLLVEPALSSIKLGDKVLVKSTEKHSGGGATNSAVALVKMGVNTKILTKLGNDSDAKLILQELKDYKIKNICQKKSKNRTDSATIISSIKEKDRIIYVHKGASRELARTDFKNPHLKVRWIYLASPMGKTLQTTKGIIQEIERKNKKTIRKTKILFNPSLYLAKRGKKHLQQILNVTNILVLNKEEAQALYGKKTKSFKELLTGLCEWGPETVIITNGDKQMTAYHQDSFYTLTPPKVKVVHTAGAGDSFTAGLLAGLIKGHSFETALKIGQANSSSVIQHLGTKNKLLTVKEALRMIKKYKIKVRVS